MTNVTTTVTTGLTERIIGEFTRQFGADTDIGNAALTWLTGQGVTFGVRLIAAAVILVLGALAIRLLVALVGKAVDRRGYKSALLGNFVRNVTGKLGWAVLIVIVLGKLGVDIAPIIAGLGVTGFILGFACQESLGNFASGMMIAINEPFKLGDYVIVAGFEGTVIKVDMMASVLSTADNKKVVIPNKSAWGAPIVNFTALGRRRVDLRIGIDYGCDLALALKVARATLKTVPGVLAEPAPTVSVAAMDESQVTLNIRPWAAGADYWAVYHDTLVALKTAFEQNGIAIPFPQLTVHLDR